MVAALHILQPPGLALVFETESIIGWGCFLGVVWELRSYYSVSYGERVGGARASLTIGVSGVYASANSIDA